MEPLYIRQTAEPMSPEEADSWLREVVAEARVEGATFFRASYHADIPHLKIVEGWATQPADQGQIRWALTLSPTPTDPARKLEE